MWCHKEISQVLTMALAVVFGAPTFACAAMAQSLAATASSQVAVPGPPKIDEAEFWHRHKSNRFLLAIGNDLYVDSPIQNAVNDANSLKSSLKEFVTIYGEKTTNLDSEQLADVIESYATQLARSKAKIGIVYFAGHAVQVDGELYLLPTDFPLQYSLGDLKDKAISLTQLLQFLNTTRYAKIVIVDACRSVSSDIFNQPNALEGASALQAETWEHDVEANAGSFAPIENELSENVKRGTIIAYAAPRGGTASDNAAEKNGLFTKHLISRIKDPIEVLEVLSSVSEEVAKEAQDQQPWIESTLTAGAVYIRRPFSDSDREYTYWSYVRDSVIPEPLDAFINKFPNGEFTDEAIQRKREIEQEFQVAELGKHRALFAVGNPTVAVPLPASTNLIDVYDGPIAAGSEKLALLDQQYGVQVYYHPDRTDELGILQPPIDGFVRRGDLVDTPLTTTIVLEYFPGELRPTEVSVERYLRYVANLRALGVKSISIIGGGDSTQENDEVLPVVRALSIKAAIEASLGSDADTLEINISTRPTTDSNQKTQITAILPSVRTPTQVEVGASVAPQ